MPNEQITQEDLDLIQYYWKDREHIYSIVEEKKGLFEREYPELIKVINDYIMAKNILDRIINSL